MARAPGDDPALSACRTLNMRNLCVEHQEAGVSRARHRQVTTTDPSVGDGGGVGQLEEVLDLVGTFR
jgi:hypothetical protein